MTRSNTCREPFGALPDGTPVHRWILDAGAGLRASVLDRGGIIQSLQVPGADGTDGSAVDVVLGHGSLDPYLGGSGYLGALVGRYGNRIAGGRFTLDGTEHRLPVNNGPNTLHGGPGGFDTRMWHVEPLPESPGPGGPGPGLVLTRTSPDGEEGFPGTLDATVTYTLPAGTRTLRIEYRAVTDRPTVCNLTQHSYFNLAGEASGSIHGHTAEIAASAYTAVDADLIPEPGGPAPVDGTPFDFRSAAALGGRLGEDADRGHVQLRHAGGIDHNFVLDKGVTAEPEPVARFTDPASGRTMTVATTEPGAQFYTGNFLDGTLTGKGGTAYGRGAGFAFETQHFPDSPNRPDFPSTVLRPGEEYRSVTEYRFG